MEHGTTGIFGILKLFSAHNHPRTSDGFHLQMD